MAAFRRVAGAAQSILDQATALHPGRSTISDGTLGDQSHAARDSDHNPDENGIVHAADLTHDPDNGVDAHRWADQNRRRVKAGQERRPTLIISNRRYASANTGWDWAEYHGDNPHEHHVHTSVTDGPLQDNESPWFTIGGLSMADVGDILEAIRNQSRIVQDVTRNQGELTRAAVEANGRANAIANRRAIWRAFGKTKKEIDELEASLDAEFASLVDTLTPAVEDIPPGDV